VGIRLPCRIDIGGKLPGHKISEFLEILQREIHDLYEGPESEGDLREVVENANTYITWSGQSSNGMCDDLTSFLRVAKMSYRHYSGASLGESSETIIVYDPKKIKVPRLIKSNTEWEYLINMTTMQTFTDLLYNICKRERINECDFRYSKFSKSIKNYNEHRDDFNALLLSDKIKKRIDEILLPHDFVPPDFQIHYPPVITTPLTS